MRDNREATDKVWPAHVWIGVIEKDVIGSLVVGGDVVMEHDLRLKDGAAYVPGLGEGRVGGKRGMLAGMVIAFLETYSLKIT